MKTILLLPEFAASGGTRTYFKFLLKFYYDEKFKVILAINKSQFDREIEDLIKKYGIEYFFIPQRIYGYRNLFMRIPLHFIWDLFILIYAYCKYRFDYIVCSIGTPSNMLAAFLFPQKVIYILHTYPMGEVAKFYRRVLNCYLNENKKIVAVSKFAKKQTCNFWVDEENYKFVRHIYAFSDKLFLETDAVEKKGISILTLGHVRDYKNPFLWIEVAEKVLNHYKESDKDIKFVWVGDGELLELCRSKSAEISTNIKFIGHKETVEELYKKADIYFQPSKIESYGLCVVDALKAKLPCIVSTVGGLVELVKNHENGYSVSVDDSLLMAEKIVELIENQQLREHMGNKSAFFYKTYFSEEKWRKEMLDFHGGCK